MALSIDTETTGVDFRHGAMPFFVTMCWSDGTQKYWEWDVDVKTRKVLAPKTDVDDILDIVLKGNDELVLQNAKFDVRALGTLSPYFSQEWPWHRTFDTLIAGHLLASNHAHDLTSMAIEYLSINIQRHEDWLKECCVAARTKIRKLGWALAKTGRKDMPSANKTVWKYDTWVPKAVAQYYNLKDEDPWNTCLREYANVDSAVTCALWPVQRKIIEKRQLWSIFETRMKIVSVVFKMEETGVTASGPKLSELSAKYQQEIQKATTLCKGIVDSYEHQIDCQHPIHKESHRKSHHCPVCRGSGKTLFKFEMPKGAGPNNSLRTFIFDVLKMPGVKGKKAKTEAPTLNKEAMGEYLNILPRQHKGSLFIRTLVRKRSRDTALGYMKSYSRFWIPLINQLGEVVHDFFTLYPSLNPTGTDTLRFSSNNPNEQNISKKDECVYCRGDKCLYCNYTGKEPNVRYCFGPAPDREWYSCDAQNIELRIPAYEADEAEMIALFEQPDSPPFYGSNHMLVFSILWPQLWEEAIKEAGLEGAAKFCKKKYASTYYQWTKNGNFAVQYGAIDRPDGTGTADRAYHQPGGQSKIKARFTKMTALNDRCIAQAERLGYVETIPDRTVDPHRGYPLLCTRTDYGKILPTVPLNYHVQGTAMWWMMKAMLRCQEQLNQWYKADGFTGRIVMQVHDELVFDFPKSKVHPKEYMDKYGPNPLFRTNNSNLWRIRKLQQLMRMGGDDIGIPTPVSCEYHIDNWSEGVGL